MYRGDNKIGRNDECHCGSNKKYKYCHGKSNIDFYPEESFLTKILDVEDINFENRAPGVIEVGRVDISYTDPFPWDSEINNILKDLVDKSWNENDRWEKLIDQRKNKLTHKLHTLRHHIELFKGVERASDIEYRKGITGNTTMNKIYEHPHLISNTESFLFQAKSTLDVFAQLVGHSFKFSITSYGNGGQKLINMLQSEHYNKYRTDADYLIEIFKSAKTWVDKLVEMRDDVTHYSDLPGLSCFMFKKINPGDTQGVVYYPSLSDGERVSKYMDFTWTIISNLITSCMPIIVRVAKNPKQ
jgi:hypothetical protein